MNNADAFYAVSATNSSSDFVELIRQFVSHFVIVEFLKVSSIYLILPVAGLIFIFIIFKAKQIGKPIKRLKFKINNKINEIRFRDIYANEKSKSLDRQLIKSALNEALSPDVTRKTIAIAQLTQFSDEEAISGLITLLSKEGDSGFRKIIIRALHSMTH